MPLHSDHKQGQSAADPSVTTGSASASPGKQTRAQLATAGAPSQRGAAPPASAARAATQRIAPWVMDDASMAAMGLGAAPEEPADAERHSELDALQLRSGAPEEMWREVIGERSAPVGKLGRVRAPKGVRLRRAPAVGAADLGVLPFDELVFVERRTEHGWCWVLPTTALSGNVGFCEEQFLALDPPEPSAHLHRVAPGDELRKIAEQAYGKSFRGGRDARLYVQAIYEANKGKAGIYLTEVELSTRERAERLEADEQTLEVYKGAKVREGQAIWLPSEAYIEALRASGQISDGTPAHAKLARGLKDAAGQAVDGAKYSAAFAVGILEGSWGAIADLFQGAADMIQVVAKTLYEIVTGNLGAIKDMLMGWVGKLKQAWEHRGDMAADFMAKWEADDAWTRGNFQGEVLGWVMMTALLIFATAGEAAVAMATGKWATVLKVLRAADALGDITTYVGRAARLPGEAIGVIRRKLGTGFKDAANAAEAAAGAEGDVARAISETSDSAAGRPELENVSTSLDGHTFQNDIRKMSPSARHIIRQLEKKGWVRVSEISPADLVEISKWFEKEIGVVQSPYGSLRVILGTEKGVLTKQILPGELFLAHTHPVVTTLKSHFDLDLQNAGRHVEAVIDWSGHITYFSRSGIKNSTGLHGVVEPLINYRAAFLSDSGDIVGYADIDIVDQATGVAIKVKK